jgi:hypothetical protein
MRYRVELAIVVLCGFGIAIDAWAYPPAQVDTHAKRRDVEQARPVRVGSAVAKRCAQDQPLSVKGR